MSREQDRELLEAAARAGGYVLEWREDYQCMEYPNKPDFCWNPLESDADVFRLMVDCGLQVECLPKRAIVYDTNERLMPDYRPTEEDYGTDKHAATRRAIVRAAAAMSEGQEG